MLITKESSTRLAAERKRVTDDLADHVGSVLRELNTVRNETKQLIDQRRQLEVYLQALRTELETLRAEKVELMALKAQARPEAVVEPEVDLVARARAAAANVANENRRALAAEQAAAKRRAEDRAATKRRTKLTARSENDEDAFQAFLEADVDHDKSREWFLSHHT
jgi:peptidoglycan hydrolase CwlO-like protein